MARKLTTVCVAIWSVSFVVGATRVYYVLLAQSPPCGYFSVNGTFQNCPDPIRTDPGHCDVKTNCQPYYTCFPLESYCYANGTYYPKRVTDQLWALGTCYVAYPYERNCRVCPSPCVYVCAAYWAARDAVQEDGTVSPCGDRCPRRTYRLGDTGLCF